MLVITRFENEDIVIGPPDNPIAVIRVVAINRDCVRIGIQADRSIPVNRAEIADQIAAGVPHPSRGG